MTILCFIDTETTGLDARIHQPYEVCWWREDMDAPITVDLPHSLLYADQQALNIGGYYARSRRPGAGRTERHATGLMKALRGVTLVGSNPAFDAAMLTRVIGTAVWHHRLINVAEGGMWTFGWDRPKGLADVANECRARGYEIPEPDHTAEGDVRATRAVYEALRAIRATATPALARGRGGAVSDFDTLADRIRSEAALATRPGGVRRLEAIATEVERLRRGAKTLGQTVDQQCRMALDASGMHYLIAADGDGDWGAVWDELFAVRDRLRDAEAKAEMWQAMCSDYAEAGVETAERMIDAEAKVARVAALADEWEEPTPGLSAAPLFDGGDVARALRASLAEDRAGDCSRNHAPLPKGTLLDPGYCDGCDDLRAALDPPATDAPYAMPGLGEVGE